MQTFPKYYKNTMKLLCVCVCVYLIEERVVGALPRGSLLDCVPTHNLHNGVQLTSEKFASLQNVNTYLHTNTQTHTHITA